MDTPNSEKLAVPIKTKLEKINSFCASFGNTAKEIIKKIIDKVEDLSDKCISLIDVLWRSIEKLESGDDKNIIIEAMKILSYVLALVGFAFPMFSIVSYVVLLVAYFLKVIFHIINLKKSLEPKITAQDTIRHELAGLADKLEKTGIFIDAVDDQEHVDEATLQGLLSNVDIHIGVSELGNLKSRIKTLMSGGEEDCGTCLEFLRIFVRISTLRHSLLFRMLTCLRSKEYSRGTISALQKYVEIERKDNQHFLAFFSVPSLENVGVLAIFNPLKEKELVAYLEQLRLSFQNLRLVLHNQIFLITPITNPDIVFGRPLVSIHSVRAMKSSTDVQNVRIRFKFTAIENEFNLFHIQSPDLGEYLFMKENSYCKYSKSVGEPDTANWRVILVRNTEEKDKTPSRFIICTKRWPDKFLYMEKTFYECARGLEINSKPNKECLFTLTPPGGSPIYVLVAEPGTLSVTSMEIHLKNREESPNKITVSVQEDCMIAFKDEHKTAIVTTSLYGSGKRRFSCLETIVIFLKKRKIEVERDIERINVYISRNNEDRLNSMLEKIANNLLNLDGQKATDEVFIGLVEMLSICFDRFQNVKFLYASILRQVLRICGLVLSCIWQIGGIEAYIYSSFADNQTEDRTTINTSISTIQRFASYLHEIECTENLFERDIREMKRSGANCEDLECLPHLRQRTKKNPKLIAAYVKLSILQQIILWQMYAVAKQPGHSDKIANHLHRVIILQKDKDVSFLKEFPEGIEMTALVKKYSTCLGCHLQLSESNEIVKLTVMQKLRRMALLIVPALEDMLFTRVNSGFVFKK